VEVQLNSDRIQEYLNDARVDTDMPSFTLLLTQ
jgi:hypothetical protein